MKYFILVLLLAFSANAQTTFHGGMFFERDTVIQYDFSAIELMLTAQLPYIQNYNGQEVIGLPVFKKFRKGVEVNFQDGMMYQFHRVWQDTVFSIELENVPSRMLMFDFSGKRKYLAEFDGDTWDFRYTPSAANKLWRSEMNKYNRWWNKLAQSLRQFIRDNGYLWLRAADEAIVIYHRVGPDIVTWFVIGSEWTKFEFDKSEAQRVCKAIKWYIVSEQAGYRTSEQ